MVRTSHLAFLSSFGHKMPEKEHNIPLKAASLYIRKPRVHIEFEIFNFHDLSRSLGVRPLSGTNGPTNHVQLLVVQTHV